VLLIAGLGNPGTRSAGNRHNIGFMAVDAIARRHSFSSWSGKFKGLIAEGKLNGQKTLLLKPQTFMNLSGESVGEVLRFYKIPTDNLVVIYDELDLEPGKARIKDGGGDGGHRGIRSINEHCGSSYRRLRLGIGHPGTRELVNKYVLGDFSRADRDWLDPMLEAIAENVEMLAGGKNSSFLNKLALAVQGSDTRSDAPKQQSHIRAARRQSPQGGEVKGPMAEMLRKLFGGKGN
jgi:PTH1 family peptidyl-tRNA hydrolase